MSKYILIFSDGTGQVGGIRPDQRLSNVYKLYQAMRPGPTSPIKPSEQVAFYDPGLGAGEVDGVTFRRVRNFLETSIGSGIDDNVVDCYEKIISYYEPGDKVLLFGFSRGAYTVRTLANVMNICGIPTRMPDGSPVPKYGDVLRKIATDAVKYVYNHGAGHRRQAQPFFYQREEKGRRFRQKYGSNRPDDASTSGEPNVQPTFIGVFDTVAALGNSVLTRLVWGAFAALVLGTVASFYFSWWWPLRMLLISATFCISYWGAVVFKSQFKYFSPDPNKPLKLSNPRDWPQIFKNGHRAVWNKEHYDKWLDSEVQFARHAMAIDEHRTDFPRVGWGARAETDKVGGRKPEWIKQTWFPGCHSDIGGSYLEAESRLSDIALDWMVTELKECMPNVAIREELLVRMPDPLALQHEEKFMFKWGPLKPKWKTGPRKIDPQADLHPSVLERFEAKVVPQAEEVKAYRPSQLQEHFKTNKFYT